MIAKFDLEATVRCNLDCRHCHVNRPEGDKASKKRELAVDEIGRLAGEAAAAGAARCVITGGEPLVRRDFCDIYQAVLSKGLRVSISTAATLVTGDLVRFLKKFPPLEIEVAVFGATRETYERVTRTPGSFEAFKRGLDRLLGSGITIRLAAAALRSNKHELPAIMDFCRAQARDAYRIDPHLDLRYDRDEARNVHIRAERLSPKEIVRLERTGSERIRTAPDVCAELQPEGRPPGTTGARDRRLFRCGAGRQSFVIGPSGILRPCLALNHRDFLFDLRRGSLGDALERFLPAALARETDRQEFLEKCRPCPVAASCRWCPARADLETGELDRPVESLCRVAEARAEGL
jgi:radical SAM protein with 4Fe4S-binding SPASM domain